MSTYLQMQDEVLNYGFDPNIYRARVKIWLNDAQAAIARKVEIPELFSSQLITTVSGTQGYTLNSNIVRIDAVIMTLSTDRVTLSPHAHKDVIVSSDPQSLGQPQWYGITISQLVVSPIPDKVYTLTVYYYIDPVDLSADSDVSLLPLDYHKAMIAYAVAEAYMAEDDSQMHTYHSGRYQQFLNALASDRQGTINDGPRQVAGTWSSL